MITKRVLKASFVAGVAGALIGYALLPMVDERQGAPGIPSALDYGLGSGRDADLIRAPFYGVYSAAAALILGSLIENLSDRERSDRDPH